MDRCATRRAPTLRNLDGFNGTYDTDGILLAATVRW